MQPKNEEVNPTEHKVLKTAFSTKPNNDYCEETQKLHRLLSNIDPELVREKLKSRRVKPKATPLPEDVKTLQDFDFSKFSSEAVLGFPKLDHSVFTKMRDISKGLKRAKPDRIRIKKKVNRSLKKVKSLKSV